MKKRTFSILFGISATAVLLGAMMKIMHFPGGMILLVSGFIVGTAISFIYSLFQTNYIKKLEGQIGDKVEYMDAMTKALIFILFILSTLTVFAGAYMEVLNISGASFVILAGFIVGAIVSSFDNKVKTKRIKDLEAQLAEKND